METFLAFIVVIGVLITVHEFGHFFAAKLFGIGVQEFSVGFGPPIVSFKSKETEYKLCWLPLGGYVRMKGEEPESSDKDGFYSKPPWVRIVVAFAGPLMNLVIAFFLFFAAFSLGSYVPSFQNKAPVAFNGTVVSVNGKRVSSWKELYSDIEKLRVNGKKQVTFVIKTKSGKKSLSVPIKEAQQLHPPFSPVIGQVVKGMPAYKAGLKPGDKIISINGNKVSFWEDLSKYIASSKGGYINLKVERGNETLTLKLKPIFDRRLKKYVIGITPKVKLTFVRYPPLKALKRAAAEVKSQTVLFFSFLKNLITGRSSIKNLGGPILIAQVAGKAARAGLATFLYFMAFISLQLAYFNLLPLPALDGGLILLFSYELIRRKPLSKKTVESFEKIGFAILAVLMIIVFYNDISRLFGR